MNTHTAELEVDAGDHIPLRHGAFRAEPTGGRRRRSGAAIPPNLSGPTGGGRHRHHRKSPTEMRLFLNAGIAVAATTAVIGASVAPPSPGVAASAVRLAGAVSDAPTPTPLLAALVESDGMPAAVASGVAIGIDAGLLGWDAAVTIGADLVAQIALGLTGTGVDINTALATALQAAITALVPLVGPLGVPLTDTLTAVVGGVSALANAGLTAVGDAIAWKAELDAVLATALAAGGVTVVNGLTTTLLGALGMTPTGLPEVDLSAAVTGLINHVAVGLDGALLGWDAAVNIGADLVGDVALGLAGMGVGINAALAAALEAAVTALTPLVGPLGAPLAATLTAVVDGITGLVDAGVGGVGTAIAWKAELDAVLATALAAGGVTLVNTVTTVLLGGLGLGPVDLPDVNLGAALTALVDHVAVGIDGALLGWDAAVNVGADLVGGVALGMAAAGVGITTALTAALDAALMALTPLIGVPLAETLAAMVGGITAVVDAGINGLGAAVAWKAELDAVLADAVAAGGVTLTNSVATAVLGGLGTTPEGLPEVNLDASIVAVLNHVVALPGVLLPGVVVTGEVGVDSPAAVTSPAAVQGPLLASVPDPAVDQPAPSARRVDPTDGDSPTVDARTTTKPAVPQVDPTPPDTRTPVTTSPDDDSSRRPVGQSRPDRGRDDHGDARDGRHASRSGAARKD